jgi:hypothetical protein
MKSRIFLLADRKCGEEVRPVVRQWKLFRRIAITFLKAALILFHSSDPENRWALRSSVSRAWRTVDLFRLSVRSIALRACTDTVFRFFVSTFYSDIHNLLCFQLPSPLSHLRASSVLQFSSHDYLSWMSQRYKTNRSTVKRFSCKILLTT